MKQVLIIDDDYSVRMTFKVLLRKAGHGFTEAENGERGLELAGSLLPDLIICDINMGKGLNGFGVIEKLRANPATASIPVILITGDPANHQSKLISQGVHFLEKPFGMHEFLQAVDKLLEQPAT